MVIGFNLLILIVSVSTVIGEGGVKGHAADATDAPQP
jgi:hypothetical protein